MGLINGSRCTITSIDDINQIKICLKKPYIYMLKIHVIYIQLIKIVTLNMITKS